MKHTFAALLESFKPKTPREAIEKGVAFIDGYKNFTRNCNHLTVYDGGKGEPLLNRSCHAGFAGVGDYLKPSRELIATDNAAPRVITDEGLRDETYGTYLRWLTKESCFAPFFIPVDDELSKKGFLIYSDIPAGLVINMCLATRMFNEVSPKGFTLFNELYEKYGGDVAFNIVMGSNLSLWDLHANYPLDASQYRVKGDDIMVSRRSWHVVTPLFPNVENLHNFLTGTIPGANLSPEFHYRRHANIYGGSVYWGPPNSGSGKTFLKEFVYANKEVKSEISKARKEPIAVVTNPFARQNAAAAEASGFKWSEIRDIILPAMQDQGLFNV